MYIIAASGSQPQLRPYQIEGVKFLVKYKRAILADEMGLGKTRQVLTTIEELDLLGGRILLVCNGAARYVWREEIKKWGLNLPFHLVAGQKHRRCKIWKSQEAGMFACTCGGFRQDITDMPKHWDLIIADEAHNLHNRKTKNFKSFSTLRSTCLFLITGSPIRKGTQNLWTLLCLVDPKAFASYWRFIHSFCEIEQGFFGMEIVGSKNTKTLKRLLETRLIRRMKRNVAPEIPEKSRYALPVVLEPSSSQAKAYTALAEEMLAELPLEDDSSRSELVVAPTVLAKLTRLRQLLVTPKLFNPELEVGAGFKAILEHMQDGGLEPHIVLFTPFAKALSHFRQALQAEGHKSIVELKGGMSIEELSTTLETFKRERGIALCSIKFAQSFDLDSASLAYFLGCEWDYMDNIQAEDRLQRLTTRNPVSIYYVKHLGTVEEDVLEALRTKRLNIASVFRNPDQLRRILRRKVI